MKTILACFSLLALASSSLAEPVRHSFLGVGKDNMAVIIDESGEIVWSVDYPSSDGWVLPDGKVLLAVYPMDTFPKGGVVLIERETKRELMRYQGTQAEISTVQPLQDGRFLVAELGPEPQAVVIDHDAKVLRKTPLQCQKENVHMQTRMLRQLANGNFLAPHLLDFAVKEYDAETGKVVQTVSTDDRGREKRDWPFTAIRLDNGHTVIACTNGNRVIEVDADGEIVWQVSDDDLGEKLFNDACGAQRLPNGNTVISSYYTKGNQVKLFEVTPDKKVVWRFAGMDHGFHHFQILTTNGLPLKENTWK